MARRYNQSTAFGMNYTIEDGTEYSNFFSSFVKLWHKIRQEDLKRFYEKMFEFFKFKQWARMPLGYHVGPLSKLMILEDPFFPDYYKQELSKIRDFMNDIDEDEDEDEGEEN